MIVLDEQICRSPLQKAISRWYPGKVAYVTDLRPSTLIEDSDIPTLLLEVKQPTFVTINYKDFWTKVAPHRGYCIVCIFLEIAEWADVDPILREILSMPEFKTKQGRMGKVISWRSGAVKVYER